MTNVAALLAATASLATTPRVAIEHLFAAFNRHALCSLGDRLIVEDDTIFDTQGRPCES